MNSKGMHPLSPQLVRAAEWRVSVKKTVPKIGTEADFGAYDPAV